MEEQKYSTIEFIKWKITLYRRKFVILYYNNRADPKWDQGIFSVKIVLCFFHACQTQPIIPSGNQIKDGLNQPRYSKYSKYKCSQSLESHNNCISILWKNQ